jgi:hypothetical protein
MAAQGAKVLKAINTLHIYRRQMIALGRKDPDIRRLAGAFDEAMGDLTTAYRKVERIISELFHS